MLTSRSAVKVLQCVDLGVDGTLSDICYSAYTTIGSGTARNIIHSNHSTENRKLLTDVCMWADNMMVTGIENTGDTWHV